jgi:excisionase family DNA binding protein
MTVFANSTDTLANELLTVQEVAVYLRVSRVTVWRWCQQGILPAFRIGRNWRIRRDVLRVMSDVSVKEQ